MHPIKRSWASWLAVFFLLIPAWAYSQETPSAATVYDMEAGDFPPAAIASTTASAVTSLTEINMSSSVTAIKSGQPFWVMFDVKLKPGWHTYWVNQGDSGLGPVLTWTMPRGFSASDIYFMPPERVLIGELMNYGYHEHTYFPVKITPPSVVDPRMSFILSVKIDLLICQEQCVPDTVSLAMTIPAGAADAPVQPSADAAQIEAIVKQSYKHDEVAPAQGKYLLAGNEAQFFLPVKLTPEERERLATDGAFLPDVPGIINNTAKPVISVDETGVLIAVAKDPFIEKVDSPIGGVLLLGADASAKSIYTQLQPAEKLPAVSSSFGAVSKGGAKGLVTAMIFAFLGGVILNLMPCVFPILSLKALTIAKKAGHAGAHKEVRREGLAYTLGVLVSFALLSLLLILLQQSGVAIGWGYQLQSPVFVLVLAYLLLLVGLNLSGAFELPVLFGNTAMTLEAKAEQKFHGLGSFAAGVLAVLVATPCTAPFMAPAIGYALTQSPLKAVLIFEMLGLGLAFPYILFAIAPALASFLPKPGAWMHRFKQFLAFPMYGSAAWLIWVIAMQVGSEGLAMALFGMVMVAFTVWLLPLLQHRGIITRSIAWLIMLLLCALPLLHGYNRPEEVPHQPFSEVKLEEERATGRGVFVNATADWCITCKVNEAVALKGDDFSKALQKYKVTYMVADWTNRNNAITSFLKRHGRSGVPLYVYYPPQGEPKILPQLLTPGIIEDAFSKR